MIAGPNEEIAVYTSELTRQNCVNTRNKMNKQIGNAITRKLPRHLLEPENTRSEAHQQLQTLVYKFKGTRSELLDKVRNRYLWPSTRETLP
ncbi:hypothetical protein HPB48_026110 [Haemaphysalis longicornis]|uniref:Uncharacterized protein n=1 Tax=Haemaphysalis longicornis TaxID=44386 RepID=A0A9J6H9Y3_HAELO|nr:hypothetical protein HPB48_026110 [Haemaphysalis longicornis]